MIHQMMFIGSMHFQDLYNIDLDRIQRCIIHYASPDGRIIPFCTMNNLHRDEIEQKFALPIPDEGLTPLYDVNMLTQKIRQERMK